jgi:hypothetical protein
MRRDRVLKHLEALGVNYGRPLSEEEAQSVLWKATGGDNGFYIDSVFKGCKLGLTKTIYRALLAKITYARHACLSKILDAKLECNEDDFDLNDDCERCSACAKRMHSPCEYGTKDFPICEQCWQRAESLRKREAHDGNNREDFEDSPRPAKKRREY